MTEIETKMQPISQVFNEDCIEVMKRYPDNYFDLAIVDPPYGIDIAEKLANGWVSKAGGTKFEAKDWDKYTPTQEYWDELFRVSKQSNCVGRKVRKTAKALMEQKEFGTEED